MLHTVFVRKGDVAILQLHRNRHQDGIAGDLHKISAHIERHLVIGDLVLHNFLQVLELDRRRLVQFGELLQTIKLLGLKIIVVRRYTEPLHATVKPGRLGLHPHFFIQREAGVGDHQQRVFLTAIHSHFIGAAHAIVHELNNDFLANSLNVAIPPIFKRVRGRFATALFHRPLIRTT